MDTALDFSKWKPTKVSIQPVIIGTLDLVLAELKRQFPIECPKTPTSEYYYMSNEDSTEENNSFEKQIERLPSITLPLGKRKYGALFFIRRNDNHISFESVRVEVIY